MPYWSVPPHPALAVIGQRPDFGRYGVQPRLGLGVRHRLQHLLFQEAGDPGIVDEEDVGDVLAGRSGEDLLLHRVVVEADGFDLHVVLLFKLGEKRLVAKVGRSGGDVAGGIPESDFLRRTGESNRRGEEEQGEHNGQYS